MTPDEIKKILESDEPSEEFVEYALEVFSNKWMVTSFEGDSTCWGYREIAFHFYQKGLRDTQREPVKPVWGVQYGYCPCGCKMRGRYKFCPDCGARLDWSE